MLDKISSFSSEDIAAEFTLYDDQLLTKYSSDNFINREMSWLAFNERILEESFDHSVPLLDRFKFLSIFSSNLDEYFMIRVGGMRRLIMAGVDRVDISGLTINQELDKVSEKVKELVKRQYNLFTSQIQHDLEKAGIIFCKYSSLDEDEKKRLTKYFEDLIYPLLTPFAVDAGHPFPFIGNLKINLMVSFVSQGEEKNNKAYAFIEIPSTLPRLIAVKSKKNEYRFVLIEDLISKHIHQLFPGLEIDDITYLRVTRNKDYDLQEDEVSDLASSIQTELRDRSNQGIVRIEVSSKISKSSVNLLSKNMSIDGNYIYKIDGPLNICDLMSIYDLPTDSVIKEMPFNPRIPKRFVIKKDIFSIIKEGDVLLHHPYDSFAVVLDFINSAVDDPDVLAIKQTLYRVGNESPIISALRRAAENGKQVTAVVELKARFDEEHNLDWAMQMRESGVNVIFGFVRKKTHCKATLVVRKEGNDLRRYVHLSTGNYNTVTAKQYTDIGLLTCDKDFGNDVSSLFNVLTGFNSWTGGEVFSKKKVEAMFHSFMISPVNTYERMSKLIDREIQKTTKENPGRIIAKLNSLVDPNIINRLYMASNAGVRIDLIVRGICCLRPGVSGVSENIRVISIIDRFLEHSRIYYFHNGGEPEIYSGSADLMPRSFKGRVEILYPIIDNNLKSRIINEILMSYLSDNVKAWVMKSDGSYERKKPKENEKPVRSQIELIKIAREGGVKSPPYEELIKKLGSKKKLKK